MNSPNYTDFFRDLYQIFVICPCCDEITPLAACRLWVPGSSPGIPRMDAILRLQQARDRSQETLERGEEKLNDLLAKCDDLREQSNNKQVRERIKVEGRKAADRRIRKIDPIFSPRGLDPQDVRLLFTPVDFLVFDGLTDTKSVKKILFLTRVPKDQLQENAVASIQASIQKGNVEFIEARIDEKGGVEYLKAVDKRSVPVRRGAVPPPMSKPRLACLKAVDKRSVPVRRGAVPPPMSKPRLALPKRSALPPAFGPYVSSSAS